MSRPTQHQAEIFEQIRANWAFEHLIVSVLTGAGVGGVLTFAIALGSVTISGALAASGIAAIFVKALLVTFLIFLAGFLSGVLIVAPLFRALEKAKRRSIWPYVAAFLAIAAAGLLLVSNMRGSASVGLDVAIPVMAASVVIAFVFARRIKPLWRAAERAEAETANERKRLQ